jgi:hypothetical protein
MARNPAGEPTAYLAAMRLSLDGNGVINAAQAQP